jgi:hypothetical protein
MIYKIFQPIIHIKVIQIEVKLIRINVTTAILIETIQIVIIINDHLIIIQNQIIIRLKTSSIVFISKISSTDFILIRLLKRGDTIYKSDKFTWS